MRRKIFSAVFIATLLTISSNVISQNPICPIGTYIADPTARVWADGKLYIYGSTDENPGYYCSYRHDVMFSSDLSNWTMVENVFASKGENDEVPDVDPPLYAPDIEYRNGTYYLYYCTPQHGYNEGVATSKSPLGPYKHESFMNVGRYNEIDPTIFIDDDGQAYYYWGQFTLKGAKMKPNMVELDTATIRDNIINRDEHFFHEGAFVMKRNGFYYIIYAHEGWRDRRPTCIAYATATSPIGPFKYGGVIIDNFGCDPESWNNHGSVAEFNGQWYIFYHRSSHASKMMRRACMEPITFNPDGSIDEVEMTSQGAGKPLLAFKKIEAERACLLSGYCRIMKIGEGNEAISEIKPGDGAAFKYIDFGDGVSSLTVRIAAYCGGKLIFREGSADGKIVAELLIPNSKGGRSYAEYSAKTAKTTGVKALYVEFKGEEKGTRLFDLDWIKFN
jgi:arabinoxylan arabinofuranohydrolase